jgi:hypothetical protein
MADGDRPSGHANSGRRGRRRRSVCSHSPVRAEIYRWFVLDDDNEAIARRLVGLLAHLTLAHCDEVAARHPGNHHSDHVDSIHALGN